MMSAFSRLFESVRARFSNSSGVPRMQFDEVVRRYEERAARWKAKVSAETVQGSVAILVTPWLDTAVPFFAIEIGLALRARGLRPVFLLDLAQLGLNDVPANSLALLEAFGKKLAEFGEVIRVPERVDGSSIEEDLASLIHENCVWATKGEALGAEYLASHPELEIWHREHASVVLDTLGKAKPGWILIPGGVFGLSGLYVMAARKLGIDFSTFDSGPGRLFVAHREIAAQSGDVPEAHRRLVQATANDADQRQHVLSVSNEVAVDRQQLRDPFGFQVAARRGGGVSESCDVLLCLNYRADTAALLRTKVFPSVERWVLDVLDWAEKRGNVRVGIRPHPVTRHARVQSTDRLDSIVQQRDPNGKFSWWIPADAQISSYDLLETAKVVLPFTSTIGIEAAWMGKPVVLGSHVYYESLGFGYPAASKDEYFGLIEEALSGGLIPNEKQRESAALCLYLMLKCRSVYTHFTPQPGDFAQWIEEDPDALWSRPELVDLANALIQREPLAWLRHLRISANLPAPSSEP